MESVLSRLNSGGIWLVCGAIVAFVAVVCVVFIVRAWRAGKALGMDPVRMRRAVTSSATFSILPSIGILLGVLALSGSLGTPWPWLRLSVIGALHYETVVADAAAEQAGVKLGAMTTAAFPTVALLMSACICGGMILAAIFNKRYLRKLKERKPRDGKTGGGFGDKAMIAMFIGLVSAYIGSYIGGFVSQKPAETAGEYVSARFSFQGDWTPLVAVAASALTMALFIWLKEKKGLDWVENFSVAGSMFVGMAVAVLVKL